MRALIFGAARRHSLQSETALLLDARHTKSASFAFQYTVSVIIPIQKHSQASPLSNTNHYLLTVSTY